MTEPEAPAAGEARATPLQASPYRQQLERGFGALRFTPPLEVEYWRTSFELIRPRLRFTLLIVALLAVAMILLDTVLVRVQAPGIIMIWRYGVLLPAILIAFSATFLREAWRRYRLTVTILGPLILAAATVLIVHVQSEGNQSIFGVLVLAITFIYYLVGLSFYGALAANVIGLVTFVVAASVFGFADATMLYQLVILLFASVVSATLAHNLESLQRQTWLEQRMLEEMAERDGLTGIYNRRRLETHLARVWEQATRESRPMALMMVDVDHFKNYNDRYGHQAGDEALKQVARVLSGVARRPLDMAARYGGEEFVVMLFDTTVEHAVTTADQVLQEVRMLGIPHSASAASDVITVSIGLAHVMPAPGRSVEGLLQIADQGVYLAKDSGRNRVEVMSLAEYAQMRTGWFDRSNKPT